METVNTVASDPSSALASLGNIFLEPKKALRDIRAHGRWIWYPLLITIALSVLLTVWYFSTVDMNWLGQQTLAQLSGKNLSADQQQTILNSLTRSRFLTFGVIGAVVVTIILWLLQALYYFFAAKIGGYEEQAYGQWFSFSVWTSFPNIIATIAAGITYIFSSAQTAFTSLDVTSLNTLIFHLPPTAKLAGVAGSVHLTTFWVLGLMTVGFALWTRKSLGKSATIVLAPWIIIYAIWIIVKLV